MKKKRLAVTGITGKTGRAFLNEMMDSAEKIAKIFPDGIRLMARSPVKLLILQDKLLKVDVLLGDINDDRYLNSSLHAVDTVLHIAGIKKSPKIVEACIRSNVRRLIVVHTTGIYSKYKEAGEEYRKIDMLVEKLCKENSIELTILRPTMIYGTFNDHNISVFIRIVDLLPVIPLVEHGKFLIQPVYYKDLGRAYLDVLFHEESTANRNFDLSGEQPILLRNMFLMISTALGKKCRFINIPYKIAYIVALLINWLSLGRFDLREKVQRLCESRNYGHELASEAFGFCPRTFEEGLGLQIAEYKKRFD